MHGVILVVHKINTIMFQTISLQCYACYTVFLTFPYSDLREHVLAMWSQCVLILF